MALCSAPINTYHHLRRTRSLKLLCQQPYSDKDNHSRLKNSVLTPTKDSLTLQTAIMFTKMFAGIFTLLLLSLSALLTTAVPLALATEEDSTSTNITIWIWSKPGCSGERFEVVNPPLGNLVAHPISSLNTSLLLPSDLEFEFFWPSADGKNPCDTTALMWYREDPTLPPSTAPQHAHEADSSPNPWTGETMAGADPSSPHTPCVEMALGMGHTCFRLKKWTTGS